MSSSESKYPSSKLQRNTAKIYAYNFFQSFLVLIPVIVPYWQQKGLSLKDIFLLQGIFGASLIVFDVPAGYLADYLGRKSIMIIGSLIYALAYQFLWFGQSFFEFALMECVLGLGMSLQSCCDVAILYSSIEKLGLSGRPARFLGLRLTAITVGEGLASLLGGALASYSLDWAAYANALAAWLPLAIALTVHEPSDEKLARGSHLENFRAIGRALFAHSHLLTLVIIAYVFYGFGNYCAIWTFQPFWKSRGLEVSWFGYLWAIHCFVIALVSRFAHQIEDRIGSKASVIVIGLLPIIGYLGMGYSATLVGLTFGLAFGICRGLNQVLFQDAINTRVPAEMRATTNSIGSLGMRAMFLVFGPVIGSLLDHQGPDVALRALGAVYVVGFALVAFPLLRSIADRNNAN